MFFNRKKVGILTEFLRKIPFGSGLYEVLPALALLAKFFDPVEVKFTLSRAIYSVEVDFYSVRVNLQSQFFMRFRRQKTE